MKKSMLIPLLAVIIALTSCQKQSAKDIINMNLKARGGKDKIAGIKTVTALSSVLIPGCAPWKFMTVYELPSRIRRDDSPDSKNSISLIYTPEKSFTVADGKSSIMTDTAGMRVKNELVAHSGFYDYTIPFYLSENYDFELVGADDLAGRNTYKLKASKSGMPTAEIYVDAETGLEIKTITPSFTGATGKPVELVFSDYKESSGIKCAYSVEFRSDSKTISRTVYESISFNLPVAPTVFSENPSPIGY